MDSLFSVTQASMFTCWSFCWVHVVWTSFSRKVQNKGKYWCSHWFNTHIANLRHMKKICVKWNVSAFTSSLYISLNQVCSSPAWMSSLTGWSHTLGMSLHFSALFTFPYFTPLHAILRYHVHLNINGNEFMHRTWLILENKNLISIRRF